MNNLSVLFMLARRNLWRNHRRTVIMLGAISIGVWAMIFMTALSQGMVTDMIRDGVRVLPGHVKLLHPEYMDDPTIDKVLPIPDSVISEKLANANVVAWATRINVPAVLSSERESRGVNLLGVDPLQETEFTIVDTDEVDGRYLENENDNGIVIGAKLADTLDTRVGKRVVIMSQTPGNDIADRGFRVVGIYKAKVEAWEDSYVFVGKATLQKLLGTPDQVTEAFVLGDDYRDVDAVFEEVSALVGDDVSVTRWMDLDVYLGTMLKVMDGFVLIWVVVIFLALSFGLVNTLVMAVFERVREIGLMLALGMRPSSILGQIIIESMMLLVIGLAIGNLLAWASVKPLESGIDISIVADGMAMMGASSVLYPDMRLYDVVLANVVVLVLGFLASLSPAWRASRYEPVEAISKVD